MEFWLHSFPVPLRAVDVAVSAEHQGYDGFLLAESQTLVGDPYVELALAAAATSTIQLGVSVTNTVTRHPSVTAAAIATVHIESHGRATLGIGRGDSALRLIGESPSTMAALESGLRDIRTYLHGESVEAHGAQARLNWLPVDLPRVPIDLAASGPATIALGATVADRLTFNLGADPALIGWAVATARQAREQSGLDPDGMSLGAFVNVACDPEIPTALRMVRGSASIFIRFLAEAMAHGVPVPESDRPIVAGVEDHYQEASHGLATSAQADAVPDEFLQRFALVGAPGDLAGRLATLGEIGLDRIVVVPASRDADPTFVSESNERFAARVIPSLAT
jgi:5,10-methylenetetrahydromethanopterin reductase